MSDYVDSVSVSQRFVILIHFRVSTRKLVSPADYRVLWFLNIRITGYQLCIFYSPQLVFYETNNCLDGHHFYKSLSIKILGYKKLRDQIPDTTPLLTVAHTWRATQSTFTALRIYLSVAWIRNVQSSALNYSESSENIPYDCLLPIIVVLFACPSVLYKLKQARAHGFSRSRYLSKHSNRSV